ncbi:hypothetical protein [Metabacillus sp. FJAT-52054]|uniref:Uncharacterized protein n=1 Tax=Metabacillus sediminis TaxID=3117746 RepID=A0ABZ2NHJ1_9BACI
MSVTQRKSQVPRRVRLSATALRRARNNLNVYNQKLSASIDFDSIVSNQEPLIIGENGVVQNYNPNNPVHRKWLED